MQNQTNNVGYFVETPNELENSINDLPEAPSDLLETPNDFENSVSDFVEAPSDLLETSSDAENSISDFVEVPSNLLETSDDSNNSISDSNDFVETPLKVTPTLPQAKPTTLKDARTATTCDKVDLQEIKDFFPTTSFKTVGDLTTHIIKNWRSVFEVAEAESQLIKALTENNVLKEKIAELEVGKKSLSEALAANHNKVGELAKEIGELKTSNTNLSGTISQEAHQAALKAAQESFTAKVKEIAEKIQDEAEKSMFKTFNQSVVEAAKDIYKKLKDDFDGSLFNFYTSKLMTEKEFLESFVELISLKFNTQINS